MPHHAALSTGTVHVAPGTIVTVNPPSPPNDRVVDNFTIGLFVGSILLFIATSVLAWKTWQLHDATKELAKDTVEGSKLADQHHQESLSPVCVIEKAECVKTSSPGGETRYGINLIVRNIGAGPALTVIATAIAMEGLEEVGALVLDGMAYSLGPGKKRAHSFDSFPIRENAAFKVTVAAQNMFRGQTLGVWLVWAEGGFTILDYRTPEPNERFTVASRGADESGIPGFMNIPVEEA
jgi:hypothetical protein